MAESEAPPVAWQRKRGAYHHDWLQNRFLQLLGSGLEFARGEFEEGGFAERFPTKLVSEWTAHVGQAERLAAELETSMSPRICFDTRLLRALPVETREWLELVVHGCWLARSDIRKLVADVQKEAKEAQLALEALVNRLADSPRTDLSRARPELESLDRCCRALSAAISSLPRRVDYA